MTAQELLHTFGEGELEVHESAVAQHHDKEAQASPRRADGDGAEVAPVDLGAFAGSELQHQKGGLAGRTNLADKLLKNGVAAGVAPLTQLLEELLGGVGVPFQQRCDLTFKGIEFTGPPGPLAWMIGRLVNPFFDSLEVQLEFGRDLGDLQSLLIVKLAQLAEGLVVDHG